MMPGSSRLKFKRYVREQRSVERRRERSVDLGQERLEYVV